MTIEMDENFDNKESTKSVQNKEFSDLVGSLEAIEITQEDMDLANAWEEKGKNSSERTES